MPQILYEDESFIVFDKPSGLLIIPTPKKESKTLVSIVNKEYVTDQCQYKLHPCHRLDRDTSGAIIFAKGKSHQKLMMDLFKERAVKKTYIALVHGRMDKQTGKITSPVEHLDRKKFRRHTVKKSAETHFKVLQQKKGYAVVEVEPLTGRTNQIRIHFSHIGHPLLGERKYAIARDYSIKFRRVALHAECLEWTHPVTQKRICVKSELAEDIKKFILEKEKK